MAGGLISAGCAHAQGGTTRNGAAPVWRRPERSGRELRELGFDPARFDAVSTLFNRQIEEGLHPGAQLSLYRHGRHVLDMGGGVARRTGQRAVTPDSMFVLYSATKAWAVVAAHMLVERGRLDLDAHMVEYWPEFGRHGKEAVTVRQALSHRGGYPPSGPETTRNLDPAREIEETPLRWPPGTANGYHFRFLGETVRELVRRIEGVDLPAFLLANIFDPLGLQSSFLGLPAERADLEERVAYVYPMEAGAPGDNFTFGFDTNDLPVEEWRIAWNRPEVHQMVIPSGGGIASAADFARFYGMLGNGGAIDGVQIMKRETIENAITRTSRPGEIDRIMRLPMPWGIGFMLGGEPRVPAFGRSADQRSFGHNGAGCTIGYADLDRGLGVAYLTNGNRRFVASMERTGAVADAIRAAVL
jgi:CubicO group peptidase (beta-lactamase class C family)